MAKEIEKVEQIVNLDVDNEYVQVAYDFDMDDICNAIYCYEKQGFVRKTLLEAYNVDVVDSNEDYNEEALKELIREDSCILLKYFSKAHDKIEEQYHDKLLEQY